MTWWSFLILVGGSTVVAILVGTMGDYLIARSNRAPRNREYPRPDPMLVWDAIRSESHRRIKGTVRRHNVERVVRDFLAELAQYRVLTGEDPGPARRHLIDVIARELATRQTPAVAAALAHAQNLLAEGPPDDDDGDQDAAPRHDPRA